MLYHVTAWKTNSNFYGHYSYTCGSLISSDKNVSRNFTKEKLRGLLSRSGNTFDILWTVFSFATFFNFRFDALESLFII